MLTKDDLKQIREVVDERIQARLEPVEQTLRGEIQAVDQRLGGVDQRLGGVEKELQAFRKETRKDLRYLRKTANLIIEDYGEEVVKLRRRIERIEDHLGLPQS